MRSIVLRACYFARITLTGAACALAGAMLAGAAPALAAADSTASAADTPTAHTPVAGKSAAPTALAALPGASLYWYDAGVRRPLQLDAQRIARFPANGPARAADVIVPADLARKDAAGTAASSPVLRDAAGATRALPGGVIITLPADTTEDDARARLQALGLQPVRRIGVGARTWLVATEPGLPSLQLANRLHETGKVSAQPNWWQPRALK